MLLAWPQFFVDDDWLGVEEIRPVVAFQKVELRLAVAA